MMTSQILRIRDFIETQNSGYLENRTLFYLPIKQSIYYTSDTTFGKYSFIAGVTSKITEPEPLTSDAN